MSEDDARRVLMDGAGIEFDPNVVNVFLSLEQFPELESFATEETINLEPASPESRSWDMFSSFSK